MADNKTDEWAREAAERLVEASDGPGWEKYGASRGNAQMIEAALLKADAGGYARGQRETQALRDELDRRALLLQKQQRQQCAELGCSEPAPPYCARHRGDWIARAKALQR